MTTERTYRAIVSYDGGGYCGWQLQPDQPTVQGEIESAIERLTGTQTRILGAGRTDTGVHALGQVTSFRLATRIPTEKLGNALNAHLPRDIRLYELGEAPPEFHARFSATWRRYWYLLSRESSPFTRRYAWTPKKPWPDADRMNEACRALIGEHDFRALSSQPKPPYDCCIEEAIWEPWQDGLVFKVRSNRFLYRMVRFLVGASLTVGIGRMPTSAIGEILRNGDRHAAPPPAPGHALYFAAVGYDPPWPAAELPIVPGPVPWRGYGAT